MLSTPPRMGHFAAVVGGCRRRSCEEVEMSEKMKCGGRWSSMVEKKMVEEDERRLMMEVAGGDSPELARAGEDEDQVEEMKKMNVLAPRFLLPL
jgi:hypothetical protein